MQGGSISCANIGCTPVNRTGITPEPKPEPKPHRHYTRASRPRLPLQQSRARAVGLPLILTKLFVSLDWVVVGIRSDLLT